MLKRNANRKKKAEKLGINGRLIDVSQQQSGALEMFLWNFFLLLLPRSTFCPYGSNNRRVCETPENRIQHVCQASLNVIIFRALSLKCQIFHQWSNKKRVKRAVWLSHNYGWHWCAAINCDRIYVLRDLARFQPATLLKETILRGCFSLFLICANGTKLRKACHMNDHTFD